MVGQNIVKNILLLGVVIISFLKQHYAIVLIAIVVFFIHKHDIHTKLLAKLDKGFKLKKENEQFVKERNRFVRRFAKKIKSGGEL